MKKAIFVFACLPFICGMTANAQVMKAARDNTVRAVGSVDFTLPPLDTDEFYISGVELAVFEKNEDKNEYHIFKDGKKELRKYIKSPESLNFTASFSDSTAYRERAKYKAAYRYHVTSKADASKITVAGGEYKDGWRLIGEDDGKAATDTGFSFYKNSVPEVEITGISYFVNTYRGNAARTVAAPDTDSTYLPGDALKKGITPQIKALDYDAEDTLTFRYLLRDEDTGTVFAEGDFREDLPIKENEVRQKVGIRIIADDGYGGIGESEWLTLNFDLALPEITSEFDDKGYAVKGTTLFSDFAASDGSKKLTDGQVYAKGYKDGTLVFEKLTDKRTGGIYRLEQENLPGGEYEVRLNIFDGAGNVSEHTFYQTLDSTPPSLYFIPDTEDITAAKYASWQNVSKKILVRASDDTAGIGGMNVKLNGTPDGGQTLKTLQHVSIFAHDVSNTKTGKLKYNISVYDRAKELDKAKNTVKTASLGNAANETKEVWLDKKAPDIDAASPGGWQSAPCSITAAFSDNESRRGAGDNSGIKEKLCSVCDSGTVPEVWHTYSNNVTIPDGGVYDVYFRATDNAGNTSERKISVKVNNPSAITAKMQPISSYMHTIYYRNDTLFVVKNTAYSTKFKLDIYDKDTGDEIKADICLKSRDDESACVQTSVRAQPTGETQRELVFNLPYTKDGTPLPDGVYDVTADITEFKADGESVGTHSGDGIGTIVIKRSTPPEPVISVSSGYVEISYPEETVAASLNIPELAGLCKRQYKTVKDAGGGTGGYIPYTDKFAAEKMTVTAIYTDIAGNTSTASKHIADGGTSSGAPIEIGTDGNAVTVEQSRAANVYYIGTRREKNSGINTNIFRFIN